VKNENIKKEFDEKKKVGKLKLKLHCKIVGVRSDRDKLVENKTHAKGMPKK